MGVETSVAGLCADRPLDLVPFGRERPGVRLALAATGGRVPDQPEVLKAPEQLGDLPLVRHAGGVGDLAAGWAAGCSEIASSTRTVR